MTEKNAFTEVLVSLSKSAMTYESIEVTCVLPPPCPDTRSGEVLKRPTDRFLFLPFPLPFSSFALLLLPRAKYLETDQAADRKNAST